MAAVWSGAISFGLVNIPVSAQTAVRDNDLSFRLLHEKDKAPVKYQRVCTKEGKELPWDEIVKGYEYEKGRFVIITKEDFESAALETSKRFEILDFVEEGTVDPRFFEKPYFLVPKAGGEKTYALLREAIRESGSLGIGKITLRQKQRLAAIRVLEDGLVLEMMRFADELVDRRDFRFPTAEDIRPQELKMARQLVGNLMDEFDPEKYQDDYRENLKRIIAAKLEGKEVHFVEPAEPEATDVIDLVSRLQESLKQTKQKPAKKRKKAKSKSKKSA